MFTFNKLRGDSAALPARPGLRQVLIALLGGVLAIAAIAGLGDALTASLLLGSFGASCVLVFGFPDVPFSQPRNVMFGHSPACCSCRYAVRTGGPWRWRSAPLLP